MKRYVKPQVDVRKTECATIIALSIQAGYADDSDVLCKEDVMVTEWDNIWQDEE